MWRNEWKGLPVTPELDEKSLLRDGVVRLWISKGERMRRELERNRLDEDDQGPQPEPRAADHVI